MQRAQQEGYRSRAAYKLIELDERFRLFVPGACVLDVGAAPGAWSQVARARVGAAGQVVAVDLLPIAPLDGVVVVQGDFTEPSVQDFLVAQVKGRPFDLILSDMAPNLSGIAERDQARSLELAQVVLAFAERYLARRHGRALMKVFQGECFEELRAAAAQRFTVAKFVKPRASRRESRELYLLLEGLKG